MEQADHSERRLTAILSADVHGYSRMTEDEADTVRVVKQRREILGARVREHHGRIVDSPATTSSPSSQARWKQAVRDVLVVLHIVAVRPFHRENLRPAFHQRLELLRGIVFRAEG